MVMDFGFLKDVMMMKIYDPFDHATMLYKDDPLVRLFTSTGPAGLDKLVILPCVPTAENLAILWLKDLTNGVIGYFYNRPETPPKITCVRVWETPNCLAIAHADEKEK